MECCELREKGYPEKTNRQRDYTRHYLSVFLVAIALAVAAFTQFSPDAGVLTMAVLDVGEGLCVVMHTPGGKSLVYDCGTSSWRDESGVGEKVAADYLQKMGSDNIDIAVLSHTDSDHMSGFASLLRKKPAKLVLFTERKNTSDLFYEFRQAVVEYCGRYEHTRAGDMYELDDGVIVEVLHPKNAAEYEEDNNASVVLRIVYGDVSFLLAGDAEMEAEDDMVDSGVPLDSDVLVVGHHGSAGSTSRLFLRKVTPEIAIISVGSGNHYGHPAYETIDRLRDYNIRTLRTDWHGAVQVTTDGRSLGIDTYKKR